MPGSASAATSRLRDSDWLVVGAFASDGDAHESEILADAETLLSDCKRNLFQSDDHSTGVANRFPLLLGTPSPNPRLLVDVFREPEYLAKLSDDLTKTIGLIARVVGSIMAIGAVFGSLNTMYSAVSARTREIATLRAIGFGGLPIVVSVMTEALTLSLLGGAVGALAAWLVFNGHGVNALGGNFTQLVFRLTVTMSLMFQGIAWALAMARSAAYFRLYGLHAYRSSRRCERYSPPENSKEPDQRNE